MSPCCHLRNPNSAVDDYKLMTILTTSWWWWWCWYKIYVSHCDFINSSTSWRISFLPPPLPPAAAVTFETQHSSNTKPGWSWQKFRHSSLLTFHFHVKDIQNHRFFRLLYFFFLFFLYLLATILLRSHSTSEFQYNYKTWEHPVRRPMWIFFLICYEVFPLYSSNSLFFFLLRRHLQIDNVIMYIKLMQWWPRLYSWWWRRDTLFNKPYHKHTSK